MLADLALSELSAPLGHITANVPENEIDCSASQSLELGIIFMLTDSRQQTLTGFLVKAHQFCHSVSSIKLGYQPGKTVP